MFLIFIFLILDMEKFILFISSLEDLVHIIEQLKAYGIKSLVTQQYEEIERILKRKKFLL